MLIFWRLFFPSFYSKVEIRITSKLVKIQWLWNSMALVDRFKLKVTAKRTVISNSIKHSRKYVSECLGSLLGLSHIQMVGSDGCLFKVHNAYALGSGMADIFAEEWMQFSYWISKH